jgi:DNA ligase (NAD+)
MVSLSIPLIGKKASKTVSKHCKGDTINFYRLVNENFDFTNLEDFGDTMNSSITNWFKENYEVYRSLATIMKFVNEKESDDVSNRSLDGKSICITGKLVKYPNRDALVKDIEDNGGKVVSGVTSKTDFLLTNDTTSGSSKNNKAKELSISIITEDEFINMIMSK